MLPMQHDDGSSYYRDTSNVIYMGWGQKTFKPSPGHKLTSDSLILFPPSVITGHGGEVNASFAEIFANNTVVMGDATDYGSIDKVDQLKDGTMQLRGNTIFANNPDKVALSASAQKLTIKQLQDMGAELGSVLRPSTPTDEQIVAMMHSTLGVQNTHNPSQA